MRSPPMLRTILVSGATVVTTLSFLPVAEAGALVALASGAFVGTAAGAVVGELPQATNASIRTRLQSSVGTRVVGNRTGTRFMERTSYPNEYFHCARERSYRY